jgi:hypothetical protein
MSRTLKDRQKSKRHKNHGQCGWCNNNRTYNWRRTEAESLQDLVEPSLQMDEDEWEFFFDISRQRLEEELFLGWMWVEWEAKKFEPPKLLEVVDGLG